MCKRVINATMVSSSSLSVIRPYVACLYIMGDGVPSLISVHRSVMLCHYRIFRNTRRLLFIYIWLVYPPPLIPEPYALLVPPSHDCQGPWPPLLRHSNVKTVNVETYWYKMLWRRVIYYPIAPRTAPTRASQIGRYSHCPFWNWYICT